MWFTRSGPCWMPKLQFTSPTFTVPCENVYQVRLPSLLPPQLSGHCPGPPLRFTSGSGSTSPVVLVVPSVVLATAELVVPSVVVVATAVVVVPSVVVVATAAVVAPSVVLTTVVPVVVLPPNPEELVVEGAIDSASTEPASLLQPETTYNEVVSKPVATERICFCMRYGPSLGVLES